MYKRISLAGADVAVTDARVADLVLEYAMRLGRAGSTDTVTLPVARNGQQEEAALLVGPASQIALTQNDEEDLDAIALPGVDELVADLTARLARLTGIHAHDPVLDSDTERPVFVDFGDYLD